MTDSASLGRATLTVDVDASAFDSELRRVRQEAEQFAPSFGGLDQLLQRIAQRVGQLEETFRGAARQADAVAQAGRNVAAQEQGFQVVGRAAQRYLASLQDVTRQLQLLQRTPLNLDSTAGSRGLGSLGEAYNDARTEANEFARAVVNGQQALANTTAGVRQQAGALAALAANTNTASASYRTFVQAQEAAAQRLTGRQRFDELSALQNAYSLGNVGRRSGSGGLSTFNGVEELLAQADRISSVGAGRLGARSGNTPLTPAVLQTFVGQLERARENTVPFTPEFDRLTAAIQRLTQLLNRAQTPLSQAGSVVPPQRPLLPPAAPGSPAFSGRAVPINPFATPASYDRFAAQQERSVRLAQKFAEQASYFDTPRTGGLRETPERLRQTIEQLTKLRDGLKQTDPLFDALNSDIAVLNSRLQRAERGQGALLARGANSVADERAFRQAQAEARAAREARLNELRQRPAQIEFQGRGGFRDFSSGAEDRVRARARQEVIDRIDAQRRLAAQNGRARPGNNLTSFLRDVPGIQESLRLQGQDDQIRQIEQRFAALTARQRQLRAPGTGGFGQSFSSRVGGAITQGLIGGSFPLLFGQPVSSAIGGGLGGLLGGLSGAAGGGFAGGLIGTALGQAVDTNLQRGVAISQALRDPINQFQALKDAAALSSKGLERNVEALIAQGRTAEAAAAIQRDIRENFGSAEEFRRFEQQQDTLGRTFGRLGVVTSSVAADPLTGLLSGLSRSVEDFSFLIGRPVPGSNRTEEDVRTDRLRSFGLFGFGRTDSGRETRQANALREEIRRAEQEARQREFTRLQRTQGAITFNELRGNRLGALQNELSAFDQNRANRLAAAPPEQRQSVANQLVQERFRLEQQISAEIRNQAALNEQSANKVLDLRRQTATLKQAPFITDRDLRLLESQDALSAARDTATAARNAAQANPENPDLQRAARETGAALEQAAQRYDNQRIATEREAARLALESSNRLGSLADRLKAAKTLPFISPRDQQVFEAALQARDAARRRNEAQAEAKQAPGNIDLQRAAAAAAKEAEVSGQNYRNSIRLAAEDLVRTQLASRNLIASLRERGSIAAASPGLTGAGVSALRARAQFNDEVRSDREVILAARQRPADVDLQRKAVESGERLKAAGDEFRANLVEAFTTARRESEQVGRSLRDATLSFQQLRNANEPGTLNSFLPSSLVAERQNQTFRQLLPRFEDAKTRARGLLGDGTFDLNFRGPVAAVNQQILDFIRAVNTEQDAGNDIGRIQEDLARTTNSLALVMAQLNQILPQALINTSAAIQDLADKDWQVYVSVPGQPTFVPLSNV